MLLLVRSRVARTAVAVIAALGTLAAALTIGLRTRIGEVLTLTLGDWPAPYGIVLVADGLTGLVLTLSGVVGLLTVLFLAVTLRDSPRRGAGSLLNRAREVFGAQALLQFLFVGVNMSFLTGDLFNLFVSFEVMLVASYGLLLLGGELSQLREGLKYVVINLIASALFLVAAGMTYGLFGTLNMADIAIRIEAHGPDPRVSLIALLLGLVFATKAAIFPLGFWLPNTYPVPTAAVSAFFAALLTKVGAYSLIRTFSLMFPHERDAQFVILALAGLTVLIGAFGAIVRRRWRHVLAFANVSSIGYIVMGAFVGSVAGLSAAVYYLTHSVIVVFGLFLVAALAERIAGESYHSEGHLEVYPWLGVAFFVAAVSLVGVPPTSGFIGKFGIVRSLFEGGGLLRITVAVAALLAGFLLLYAVMQIWRNFFWGSAGAVHRVQLPRIATGITGVTIVLILTLAALGGPVFSAAERVAEQLSNNHAYLEAVFPRISKEGP
jgi:multicomponent Na+:H+ antiporter subunit D